MVKFIRVVLGEDINTDIYDMLLPDVMDADGVEKATQAIRELLSSYVTA